MRPSSFVVFLLVAMPARALADGSMRTTAVQAEEMAPWWVWWTSLFLLTLVAYPLALRAYYRARSGNIPHLLIWLTSGVHLTTGVLIFLSMFALSLGYSRTHPAAFIAVWVATTIAITVAACMLQSTRPRSP
jgi:hypothetical protein